jgi:peptidoglycan/LPS O-acetylase OafA/YrhL
MTIGEKLPGLNGLRGLAALGVTLHHFEQIRSVYGLPSLWHVGLVLRLGGICVTLFFVLSGFLITFLLLRERETRNDISVRSFYMRRILRVWPLYFFTTALGFFVLPFIPAYTLPDFAPVVDADYWRKFAFYITFMPHVELWFYPSVNYAGVLWSVGVEEWFYLGWPWLVLWARTRLWLMLIAIAAFFLAGRHIYTEGIGYDFFGLVRFDCMAIGALGAVLATSRSKLIEATLKKTFSTTGQIVALAAILISVAFILFTGSVPSAGQTVFSFYFLWLILNLAVNPSPLFNLEFRAFEYLGKISYGMYCLNWVALISALLILKYLGFNLSSWTAHGLHLLFAVTVTIAIATLSYRFIEKPFLTWKTRSFSATEPRILRHSAAEKSRAVEALPT